MYWRVIKLKKLIVVLMIVLLGACKQTDVSEQVEEFSFNGKTYIYSDTTSLGYDLFNGNGHLMEVKCDEYCIISFEIDDDIYIISGTSESYDISKNGMVILIDGEDSVPTGMEMPDWNDDVLPLIKAYKK
jgi:hypothetical protein